MEWKFWDKEHNMLNFGLLCSPSLRETNMFTAVGLKLRVQILWVLHHPLNHTWARNTNAPTLPQIWGSHIDMVYVGVCLLRWFFFSKFGIAISTVEPWWLKSILLNYQVKKNVVLPSATDPSPKIKLQEIRVRNVPNFCQIRCFFSPFFEEKGEKCTQLLYFGCFFKNYIL